MKTSGGRIAVDEREREVRSLCTAAASVENGRAYLASVARSYLTSVGSPERSAL